MNCPRCAVSLPEDARFCLECGAPTKACQVPGAECRADMHQADLPEPGTARGTRNLARDQSEPSLTPDACLMQANLLRIRGRWDEAVQRCAEALQQQPANASAHSLLGDIYENRGRLEEAVQWYQLALDLNPASASDQTKLARARERLAARGRSAASVGCTPSPCGRSRDFTPGYSSDSPLGNVGDVPPRRGAGGVARGETPGSRGAAAISWLRVATVTGVAFCCTILALAIVFSASDRREGQLHTPSIAYRGRPLHGFPFWGRSRSTSRAAERLEVGSPAPAASGEQSDAGNTPRELQLLAGLDDAAPPAGARPFQSLRANDVRLDPRTSSAEITASLEAENSARGPAPSSSLASPPPGGRLPALESPPDTRWSALTLEREAYRLAARLTQLDRSLALIHVRVRVPLADPNDRRVPELALVATLESGALTADPDHLTGADLQNLFRSAWWAPPLR